MASPLEIARRNEMAMARARQTLADMAARKEQAKETQTPAAHPWDGKHDEATNASVGWARSDRWDNEQPDGAGRTDKTPRTWGHPHNTGRTTGKSTQKSQRAGSDRRSWEHGVGR